MKTLRLHSGLRLSTSLGLLCVFLAACAAGTPTAASTEPVAIQPSATMPSTVPTTDVSIRPTAMPTDAPAATAFPVATSRGPELHATDPSTVKLASGGLQLVEFFRFT